MLLLFISFIDWRSGRSKLSVNVASEIIQTNKTQIHASLRRLKTFNIVVPCIDRKTSEKYYMVNPDLVSFGSAQQNFLMKKTFMNAVKDNTPFMDDVDVDIEHSC